MEATIISKPAFAVVGMVYRGKNENQRSPNCGGSSSPRFGEVTGAVHPDVCYGVCDNMDESSGEFDYAAVMEVSDDATAPEGMVRWDIPAQTYVVFECTLPTIGAAFDHIHNTWFPQSDYQRAPGPEFELYDKNFDPNNPSSKMQIYIPIQDKPDSSQ